MNLLDRFLFRDRGIIPTKRFLLLVGVLSILLLIGAAFFHMTWTFIFGINLVVMMLSLVDLFYTARKKELIVKRYIPQDMERGEKYTVTIEIQNHSNYHTYFRFIDDLPLSFTRPFPVEGMVNGGDMKTVTYETKGTVRGDYSLRKIYFRFSSIFRLWEKQTVFHVNDAVKVIPNLTSMKNYLQDAQQFLLYEGERIRKQLQGTGEFSKVRSYVVGDDPRLINWRQTAKLQEVMVNEYEPEQSKYVTLLIDCGRMMGVELKDGNRLERSLEAAMTVAAAALKRGDYVSVLAFSKQVKRYIPPAKGMSHLQTILEEIYNLEVEDVQSNYGIILHELQAKQSKRSLLLLFSDIQPFLYDEVALFYLQRLRMRHLFLLISIKDEVIAKTIDAPPENVEKAMIKSIAQQFELKKKSEKRKWERAGLIVVEAKEERLATVAVSHFIDIMNRGLL